MNSSMSEFYIRKMARNNVIDLSASDEIRFGGFKIPFAPVLLTYDEGSQLIRVQESSQLMLDVPEHVSYRVRNPVISMQIAKQLVEVEIFATYRSWPVMPHEYYEVFLIPSKHSHACTEDMMKWNSGRRGFRSLRVRLTPDTGMTLCCDFIGIRTVSDEILQTRFPGMSLEAIHHKKPKTFRILFRTTDCDSRKLLMQSNCIYY